MLFATIKRLKMCVVTKIGLHRGNAFRYCCEQIFAEIVVNVEENIYLCFVFGTKFAENCVRC